MRLFIFKQYLLLLQNNVFHVSSENAFDESDHPDFLGSSGEAMRSSRKSHLDLSVESEAKVTPECGA